MKTHIGSCHCGAVRYEVTGDFTEGISCNCSHCKRKSLLLTFVPVDAFKLLSGEDAQTTYHFNKHHIDHTFCKTCGVQSYAYGGDGQGNHMYAINLNCIEDLDLADIKVNEYDGASA